MKNLQEINKLLAKFYNGESSKDDELYLIKFFRKENIPDELNADKELFLYLKDQKYRSLQNNDLSEKIWQNIQNTEKKKKHRIRRDLSVLSGIAASILIFIISFHMLHNNPNIFNNEYKFEDTYTNPELAYLETKQALLYISEKFNKGTEQLKPIAKFNDGIEELEPINQYNKGSKYFK